MAVACLRQSQYNDLTGVYDEIETCWEYDSQGENLLRASRSGQVHLVQEILARYPHPDVVDHAGKSALMYASEGGQEQVVWSLFFHGCNVDLTDHQHRSALTYAVNAGQTGIAFDLCLKKAELNRQDQQGNCVLHYATGAGVKDMVKILLLFGADVRCQDADGRTPLHMAVSRNLIEIVEVLLQWKAPMEVKDNYNMTPLYLGNKTARCQEILHKYRKKESHSRSKPEIVAQWRKDLDSYFRRVSSMTTAVPLASYDQLDGIVLTRSSSKPSQGNSTKRQSRHNSATSRHQENHGTETTTRRKSSTQSDTADCCFYCNDRDPDLPVPVEDAPKRPQVSNEKHDSRNFAENDDEEIYEKTDDIVERCEVSQDNVEGCDVSQDNVYRNLMPPSLPPRQNHVDPGFQPPVDVSDQGHVTDRNSIVQKPIADKRFSSIQTSDRHGTLVDRDDIPSTPVRRHEPLRRCGFSRAEWNQQVTLVPSETSGQPPHIAPVMKPLAPKTRLDRAPPRPVEIRENGTDLTTLLSLRSADQLHEVSCPSPVRKHNSTQTSFLYNSNSSERPLRQAHQPLGQTRSEGAAIGVIRSIESSGSEDSTMPHVDRGSEEEAMTLGDRGFTQNNRTPRPSQRKKLPLKQTASAEPRLETLEISTSLQIDVETSTNTYKDEQTNTGVSEHLSANFNKQQSNQSLSKTTSENPALELPRQRCYCQGETPFAPRPMQRNHQPLGHTVSADSFLGAGRTVGGPPTPKKRQNFPAVKSLSTGNPVRNPVCRTDHLYEWSRAPETEDPSTSNEKTSSGGPYNKSSGGPHNTSSHACGSGNPCTNSHVLLLKNSNKSYFNITEVNIKKADNLVFEGRISVRHKQSDHSADSDDHSDHSTDNTQENCCSQEQ